MNIKIQNSISATYLIRRDYERKKEGWGGGGEKKRILVQNI